MRKGRLIAVALGTALVLTGAYCGVALAQTDSNPPNTPPAEQMLNEMLQPTTQPAPAEESAAQPGLTPINAEGTSDSSGSPLLREGSTIVDRTGWLKIVPDSTYAQFVFDQDGGPNIPPMYVLPDLRLMQIEDAVAVTKSTRRFTVSGTITEYKGNNYILLESQPLDDSRELVPGLAPVPTTNPAAADQMLDQMLSSNSNAEPPLPQPVSSLPDSTSGSAAVAPAAPLLNVVQEGSQIIDRTGRLTHTADGREFEFTFDSDGSALQDAPLMILPNLKLATMESAVAGSNRDLHFRVTGLVTEFRGRNCILLEKVVVVPDTVQQF